MANISYIKVFQYWVIVKALFFSGGGEGSKMVSLIDKRNNGKMKEWLNWFSAFSKTISKKNLVSCLRVRSLHQKYMINNVCWCFACQFAGWTLATGLLFLQQSAKVMWKCVYKFLCMTKAVQNLQCLIYRISWGMEQYRKDEPGWNVKDAYYLQLVWCF